MAELTVVKCGGHTAVEPRAVCRDLAWLRSTGHRVVLVHGGSVDIDRFADRLGVPRRRLRATNGTVARHTDQAMLEVVQLALGGVVKPRFVSELAKVSVPAAGLTGMDAGLVLARRKAVTRTVVDGRVVVVRDNHAGLIERVNTPLLRQMLASDVVPVLSPPAITEDGAAVNVDADRMAAAVASALSATSLIMLTAAPGVLRDPHDEASVLPVCHVDGGTADAELAGGMAVKVHAGERALRTGVPRVVVADGRLDHPVRAAMEGGGTTLKRASDGVRRHG
ncbi:[LysW]-aminoadipate kinase [Streptomyces luomodiensis]|uniref:[LysW]-aminoadipate kinase n=1 Tax=Streptomyces luomodiensis TaxID=3026192 RepID=A0ABY9V5W3_9ACTN|nr:[LysW]-aminoadipate kinase [Streptomyces sp. SCA4-21]WNF00032.1 [LysW]-aminoadipate kinase [Streptomyces sp. SCA4-21]